MENWHCLVSYAYHLYGISKLFACVLTSIVIVPFICFGYQYTCADFSSSANGWMEWMKINTWYPILLPGLWFTVGVSAHQNENPTIHRIVSSWRLSFFYSQSFPQSTNAQHSFIDNFAPCSRSSHDKFSFDMDYLLHWMSTPSSIGIIVAFSFVSDLYYVFKHVWLTDWLTGRKLAVACVLIRKCATDLLQARCVQFYGASMTYRIFIIANIVNLYTRLYIAMPIRRFIVNWRACNGCT